MTTISIDLRDDFTALFRTWVECEQLTTDGMPTPAFAGGPPGVELRRFAPSAFDAELAVGPMTFRVPATVEVSGCVALCWTVRAQRRLEALRVRCEWSNPPEMRGYGPSSGEGLDCLQWELDGSVLALGTEDGDFLGQRASRGDGVPRALAGDLDYGTVEYTDSGLVVPFSRLEVGEVLEVHFVIAWKHAVSEDDVSAWLAVDQDHEHVMRALGVRPVGASLADGVPTAR